MKFVIFVAIFLAFASGQTVNRGPRLNRGECLVRNEIIWSEPRCFRMLMTASGNIVIQRDTDNFLLWTPSSHGGDRACMQHDGNFVVSDFSGRVFWATGTRNGFFSFLQSDGQLTIRDSNGFLEWTTGRTANCI